MSSRVAQVPFRDYAGSVAEALDAIGAAERLEAQDKIILKPNLVNDSPHPVTTPPACTAAVAAYCQRHAAARLIIAEGCGGLDTRKAFERLGYTAMAEELGVELVDLDREETVTVANPDLSLLPAFPLPKLLEDAFFISIPVLKAHTMSTVSLSLKNLFGIAPAKHFAGSFYRKSKLHGRNNGELHRYIVELAQYRPVDLAVMDATVGLADSHLGGATCSPPAGKILASFDPVALDATAAGLLGHDWRHIPHLRMAHGLLGEAE